jgi:uncharacterized membrane protein YkvA (DUF1232 family)
MKLQLKALYIASKDSRTPRAVKWLILATIAYAVSPIDLIPDFIPILGYVDDLLLLPIGIYLSIKLIPDDLWLEYKTQAETKALAMPKFWLMPAVVVCVQVAFVLALTYYIYYR